MRTITATVDDVTFETKNKNGKSFKVYTIELDNGDKLNAGFVKPKVDFGVKYTFNVEDTAWGVQFKGIARDGSTTTTTSEPTKSEVKTQGNKSYNNSSWEFPIAPDNYNRSVCRRDAVRDALTAIVQFGTASSGADAVEKALELARQIEAYTTGDEDIALAKTKLKEYQNTMKGIIID